MNAFLSISHSFLQHLRHLPLRQAIRAIWFGAKGLVRALRHKPTDMTALRHLHCRDCPLFDEHWHTCGTPGEMMEGMQVGCWCYLPIANRDPKKDCWLRAKGHEQGWPDLLRPE